MQACSNRKLQNILYFLQAAFLTKYDRPLFNDTIQANTLGPIVYPIYLTYTRFGDTNLPLLGPLKSINISDKDQALIDKSLDLLLPHTAQYLSDIACNQRPWLNAWSHDIKIISNESIKQYFSEE